MFLLVRLPKFVVVLTIWSTMVRWASTATVDFISYQPSFSKLVGDGATGKVAKEMSWEAFHEGGIYNRKDNSLYISSNFDTVGNPINITVLSLNDLSIRSQRYENLSMPNGGSVHRANRGGKDAGPDKRLQIWCDQGDMNNYSKVVLVDPNTNRTTTLFSSFFDRNFSSINDIRQHPETGDLWFTDATYAYFNGFRPNPQLPTQVYRYDADTKSVQVVADGLQQPNGIEFSPDFKTLYVSDTGAATTQLSPTGPATIYAFDIVNNKRSLIKKRVFAYASNGIPDGIHTDIMGNVWASCGDGVHAWDSSGVLLGKVFTNDYTSNFAFVPGGMFIFSNKRLWVIEKMNVLGREVCNDFGSHVDPRCHG